MTAQSLSSSEPVSAEKPVEKPSEAHGHAAGGVHSERHYVKIWAILVVLLVISVAGPELGIPVVTLITAFGIAVVKAYLVASHFMHLNIERRYVVYLLTTAVALMVVFFAGVAPDVLNHEGDQWTNEASKAEVQRALAAEKAAGGHGHGEAHAEEK